MTRFKYEFTLRGYTAPTNAGDIIIFCNQDPIEPLKVQISSGNLPQEFEFSGPVWRLRTFSHIPSFARTVRCATGCGTRPSTSSK
jgi:hypothetical protein